MKKVDCLPSSLNSKAKERKYVSNVLKRNGYTKAFIRNCQKLFTTSSTSHEREPGIGFAVIPYIQGIMEPIKRILNSHNVKVAKNPFQTLGYIFAKPKDPVVKEQGMDTIYSIPCNDCHNEYIRQTKHRFGTPLKEHQKVAYGISSPISRAIFQYLTKKVGRFFHKKGIRLIAEGLGFKNRYKFNVNPKWLLILWLQHSLCDML